MIALSGCLSGRVSRALSEGRERDAESELDRLEQIFGRDNTYVELQNAGLDIQQPVFTQLPGLPRSAGCRSWRRVTSTTSTRRMPTRTRLSSASSRPTRSRTRITGSSERTSSTSRRRGDGARLPGPRRRDAPVARDRRALQRRARVRSDPSSEVPGAGRPRCVRLSRRAMREGDRAAVRLVDPELDERLRFELKTVARDGIRRLLPDRRRLHRASRSSDGVSVGPGRGSAAGSLAAYALGITDIDPMRYGLLFERFLNPARKDMPDMDIDFAVEGRERVINYVAEKYGRDRVAQIITFSTMAARAALRDAGRVLEIPYGVVDRIAKLVPEGPGQTLEDAMAPGAELRKVVDSDPIAREILELARPLEGLTRADSIHAAGVVIGAQPLIEVVPLQQKGGDAEVVTQFSMKNVEALGLLKVDFLGLRNLDVIDKAVDSSATGSTSRRSRWTIARRTRCSRGPTRPVSSSSSRRGCATRSAPSSPRVRGHDRAGRAVPPRARCSTSRATPRGRTARKPSPTSTSGSSRSPATRMGSASTRSSTCGSRSSSRASSPPRPRRSAARSARRSTS